MNNKSSIKRVKSSLSELKKEDIYIFTCEHEFHALNNSPVKTIGGIRKGKPTTVEQKSISICPEKKEKIHENLKSQFLRDHIFRLLAFKHISIITSHVSHLRCFGIHGKDSFLKISQKGVHNQCTRHHNNTDHAEIRGRLSIR